MGGVEVMRVAVFVGVGLRIFVELVAAVTAALEGEGGRGRLPGIAEAGGAQVREETVRRQGVEIAFAYRGIVELEHVPRIAKGPRRRGGIDLLRFVEVLEHGLGVLVVVVGHAGEEGGVELVEDLGRVHVVAEAHLRSARRRGVIDLLRPGLVEAGVLEVGGAEIAVAHEGRAKNAGETELLVAGAFVAIAVRRIPVHDEIHLLLHLAHQVVGLDVRFVAQVARRQAIVPQMRYQRWFGCGSCCQYLTVPVHFCSKPR